MMIIRGNHWDEMAGNHRFYQQKPHKAHPKISEAPPIWFIIRVYIYIIYIINIYIYGVKSCKIPKLHHANLTFSMGRVLVAVAPLCSPPESALPDAELATWRSSSAPPVWWTLLGVLSQLFGVKIRWLYHLACTLIPPTAPPNLEVGLGGWSVGG